MGVALVIEGYCDYGRPALLESLEVFSKGKDYPGPNTTGITSNWRETSSPNPRVPGQESYPGDALLPK